MEIFDRILELINANLIYCLPAMILTLLILQLLFKDRLQFKKAYRIIKWIIIGYAIVNLIYFLIGLIVYPDQSAFLNRATGKYWLSYWIMMFSVVFLPFSLLYKNIGLKPFYLLFVSVMMKIGWYFEKYVIFFADYNIRQFDPERESDWLTSPWSGFYLTWIQGLILALILIGLTTIIGRNKRTKTVHNTV
ncbi:hypothetical protein GSB9_03380 [Flavobacteriaceae bacterium GSB9]|nr:hypothetical protein GSB9_03380 [Flavobacteriaceae bacterium GSB9]